MTHPLQRTKLFIPPERARLVDRPRLRSRLDGLLAEGCRAALVSAPAGSGKTTLVVQWLNRTNIPVGWLALDSRDNVPERFFGYLIAAFQQALPGISAESYAEALSLLILPGANLDEGLTLLTNILAEAPGKFILALDDLHTITNPQLHKALDQLIEIQPPQMRLVLLSREDPAVQLARRRARGQLVELRQEDLRFRLDEAVAFLNHSMGLNLSTAQAQALEARTEGWIAGLQMAALTLQHSADIERFLSDFSGSHRFILDYLVEEVLAHQSAEMHDFLLATSILERMNAGLCAAVTGKNALETQSTLEQLAKANLFVVPLDEERQWYRYHHLFRDLLLARLKAGAPARAAELERRASDWYENNGDPRLAVEYALRAQDKRHAADLIDRHIAERWQTVDLDFHLLINRLPFEVIAERPSLSLQRAWLCVMFGQVDQMLPFIEAAERGLTVQAGQDDGHRAANLAANRAANCAFARTLRAYLLDFENQPVVLDDSLELAYAAIPEENVGMRNSVAVVAGTIYYMEGAFSKALRFFEAALSLDKRTNGTNAVPISTMRITLVHLAQGRLHEAVRRLNESNSYIQDRGIRRFYIAGVINVLLGEIMLEWNRLEEAEAQIQDGLRLLDDWPLPQVRSMGLSVLSRLLTAQGKLSEAADVLGKAGDLLQQQPHFHPIFLNAFEQARVRLWITGKNRAALETWAEAHAQAAAPERDLRFRYEARLILLCEVWLALGRRKEAAELLERLALAAVDRPGSSVKILALMASAYSQEPERAEAALDKALRLAEPEDYLQTFVEAGDTLRLVLTEWLQKQRGSEAPRLVDYGQRIVAAFQENSPERAVPALPQDASPEPLSQRELEVLQLMALGLTNQQIADRLVISVRTVKKHVENIHGKLGVQNRTQAVSRAREQSLLR